MTGAELTKSRAQWSVRCVQTTPARSRELLRDGRHRQPKTRRLKAAIVATAGRQLHRWEITPGQASRGALWRAAIAASSGRLLVLRVLANGGHAHCLVECEGPSVMRAHGEANLSVAAFPELDERMPKQS